MLSADALNLLIWSILKICPDIQNFYSQVIKFDFHFQSDLLNVFPSYSCLTYILPDLNTHYFVLLTGNNPFSSRFIHSADIDKWVVTRYTPCSVFCNIICIPFRVKGVHDSYT